MVSLCDIISIYCAFFLEEVSSFQKFQFELKLDQMNVEDQILGQKECYDELWLLGKKCWDNIFICAFIMKFGIEEFIYKKWFGFVPLRHGFLFQKGSYFSQLVNGFT